MAADAPSDPRHAWLQEWVSLKLGVRVDRYQKLLATPDEAAAVTSFIESADCMCIFFALKDRDLLTRTPLVTDLEFLKYSLTKI